MLGTRLPYLWRTPIHQEVEKTLDGAGGLKKEGKIGVSILNYAPCPNSCNKYAKVLDKLGAGIWPSVGANSIF